MCCDVQIIFIDGQSHTVVWNWASAVGWTEKCRVSVFGTQIKNIKLSWWKKCCCFSIHNKRRTFAPYFWMDIWEQNWSLWFTEEARASLRVLRLRFCSLIRMEILDSVAFWKHSLFSLPPSFPINSASENECFVCSSESFCKEKFTASNDLSEKATPATFISTVSWFLIWKKKNQNQKKPKKSFWQQTCTFTMAAWTLNRNSK